MTVVAYLRVSTSETRQHGRAQRKALRDAGAERIYEDAASGSRAYRDRPELSRLLDELKRDDVVVVYALSRATRSLADLLALVAELEAKGVGIKSVTEGQVDTSTPHGKFLVSILGAVAEMELEWTRARVRSGLAAARERGRVGGRRPKLSPQQVELAKSLRAEGKTVNAICELLSVSRPTIYKALAA
jgi:DNA invertase Pin-like site-specific DNA recombinase